MEDAGQWSGYKPPERDRWSGDSSRGSKFGPSCGAAPPPPPPPTHTPPTQTRNVNVIMGLSSGSARLASRRGDVCRGFTGAHRTVASISEITFSATTEPRVHRARRRTTAQVYTSTVTRQVRSGRAIPGRGAFVLNPDGSLRAFAPCGGPRESSGGGRWRTMAFLRGTAVFLDRDGNDADRHRFHGADCRCAGGSRDDPQISRRRDSVFDSRQSVPRSAEIKIRQSLPPQSAHWRKNARLRAGRRSRAIPRPDARCSFRTA